MAQNYDYLSNDEDGSKKKLPSTLIAFEQSFDGDVDAFIDVILHAHQMTLEDMRTKRGKFQMRMTKSTLMNGNIKGLLFDQFPNEMKESKSSRFYLHRSKDFILLFKKLDERLMPSNIGTRNSRKIFSQMAIDFEEDLPIVFIGYTVDESWERIKQIVAVFIKDGKKLWVSDLLNRGGEAGIQTELFTPIKPQGNNDDDIAITPKRRDTDIKKSS
ncbi:hypothetical protein [Mucilaginibacter panaciglaebae]|uniref:Phage abortive infection protein n=1 Tax=Mucilaginibacter panaciglaebae TaxID=502331 RepID=A0ABP7X120_9SPHI